MGRKVFAYGSLQAPEIMTAVTGRKFPSVPALLPGYSRSRLRGCAYPGLRLRTKSSVQGVLYGPVDRLSLLRLDRYEDRSYERRTVAVMVQSGRTVRAEAYVIPPRNYRLLEAGSWSLQCFSRYHRVWYLRRCRRSRGVARPRSARRDSS